MTDTKRSQLNGDSAESPVPPHLHHLQETIRRAFRLLIVNADNNSEFLELPVGQFRCLRRIMDQEGCKLVDLARETNLSLPNASRLVDRLVQRRFVLRETDPSDRRAVRLYVTPQARETINAINKQRLEHMTKATRSLTPAQIEEINANLQVLIDAAELQAAKAGLPEEEDNKPLLSTGRS